MDGLDLDQPSPEKKRPDRDSGIGTLSQNAQPLRIIATQPQSCNDRDNYLTSLEQGHQDGVFIVDQSDACCMCKVGGFYLGFSENPSSVKSAHKVQRQSHRVSNAPTVASDLDSDFYEASSVRPSIITQDDIPLETFQDKINITEPKRSSMSKRVSFHVPDQDLRRASSPNLFTIPPESKSNIDNDQMNELKFILQSIDESVERHAISPEKLAGKRIELENFAAIYAPTTCNEGIKLCIPGTRISLYMPPFALQQSNVPQLVYIYQCKPDEVSLPSSDGKEAWATPVIKCGPPGLVFRKPVFLTMPYTFKINLSQMHISAYHRGQFVPGGWQGLRDGVDTVVMAQEQEVSILITGFCKYGCTAQSPTDEKSKWMKALVDADQNAAERTCRIDVRLVDMDKAPLRKDNGDRNNHPVLSINNNGGEIHMTINGIDRKWKRIGPSWQLIPCDQIWSKNTPSVVTFNAELKEDADDTVFRANIDIYQDDNDQPRVSVSATTGSDKGKHGICEKHDLKEKREKIKESIDQQFLRSNIQFSPHFKRQELYCNLCIELDNAMEQCGWKPLACQMGFTSNETVQWISHMAQNSGNYSESSILINWYLKDATGDDVLDKMKCLSNHLLNIQNIAAKNYVDEEIHHRQRQQEITDLKASLANWNPHEPTSKKRQSSRKKVMRAASSAMAKTKGLFQVKRKSYTLRHSSELEDQEYANDKDSKKEITDDKTDPSVIQTVATDISEVIEEVQEQEDDEFHGEAESDDEIGANSVRSAVVKDDSAKYQNIRIPSIDNRKASADSGYDHSRPTSVLSTSSAVSSMSNEPTEFRRQTICKEQEEQTASDFKC